jgi:cytochrome c peroxidase
MHWDGGINHIEVCSISPCLSARDGRRPDCNWENQKEQSYLFCSSDWISGNQFTKNTEGACPPFTASLVWQMLNMMGTKGEAHFDQYEQTGYEIFKTKCSHCHREPFTDFTYQIPYGNGYYPE